MIDAQRVHRNVQRAIPETRMAAMLRVFFGHLQRVRGIPRLLWWLRKIAFPASPVLVHTPAGLPLTIDPRDYGQLMLYYFAYCPELLALIDDLVMPGDVCLDLGANVGLITMAMAQQVGDSGKVIAVEPNPTVAGLLAYTASNHHPRTIIVTQSAIGGRVGQGSWSQPQGRFSESVEVSETQSLENPVRVITIDDLLDAFAPGSLPTLIKVDIEGSEVELATSMQRLLKEGVRPMLLVEFHPQKCAKRGIATESIRSTFVSLGYEAWQVLPDKNTYRLTPSDNTILAHENLLFSTPSHLMNKIRLCQRALKQ